MGSVVLKKRKLPNTSTEFTRDKKTCFASNNQPVRYGIKFKFRRFFCRPHKFIVYFGRTMFEHFLSTVNITYLNQSSITTCRDFFIRFEKRSPCGKVQQFNIKIITVFAIAEQCVARVVFPYTNRFVKTVNNSKNSIFLKSAKNGSRKKNYTVFKTYVRLLQIVKCLIYCECMYFEK